MSEAEEEARVVRNNKLLMDAMMTRMEQMMNTTLDAKLEAFRQEQQQPREPVQNDDQPRRVHRENRNQQRQHDDEEAASYYSQESDSSRGSQRNHRRAREGRAKPRDNLGGLKLRIPPFHGKNDPDAYLEWEKKIELVFNCQHYTEINRVRVAATEFYDYALSWWDQLVTSRRRNREYPVETWTEMKTIMRKRFVPSHHHRELHNKLRKLTQGSRSVEDYYQELETLLIRADVSEDREATMSRFLGGLNRDIQDRLEMQHYVDLEEMLHKAILVEQQLKRRSSSKSNYGFSSANARPSYGGGTATGKPSYQREERYNSFQREEKQIMTPKAEAKPYTANQDLKGKAEIPTRSRDVKCFKCQGRGHYANECINKRVMIMLDNGDIESENEKLKYESLSECEELPTCGELLVTRRSLSL